MVGYRHDFDVVAGRIIEMRLVEYLQVVGPGCKPDFVDKVRPVSPPPAPLRPVAVQYRHPTIIRAFVIRRMFHQDERRFGNYYLEEVLVAFLSYDAVHRGVQWEIRSSVDRVAVGVAFCCVGALVGLELDPPVRTGYDHSVLTS